MEEKIVVVFRATGDAPILKNNKVKISGEKPFREVVAFLNKSLGISIFAYLNGAFAPSLDELVGVLSKSHGVSGQLIVNYASTPAWG